MKKFWVSAGVAFLFQVFASLSAADSRVVEPPCCRGAVPNSPPTDRSLYLLESTWTSDVGRQIRLSQFRGRTQIVILFFAQCEYACPILVHELITLEKAMPPEGLSQVDFLLVSLDSKRDTPAALAAFRLKHKLTPQRWSLLRGDADDVRELAALLGVNYAEDTRGQFAHSNVITVLNREGEIAAQHVGLKHDAARVLESLKKTIAPLR